MSQITTKWISDDAITPEKLADSSAFTMAGLTNNGPLSVSGDATFSSNAVIQGNVQIDGTTTFADATIASLNMTGDLSIGGTLDVLGTTTLSDATVNNNLKVEGTLTVIDTEIIVSDQLEVNQQADNQFAIKAIQAPGHTVSAVRVDNSGTGQSLYLNQIGSGTALQIASAGYAFVTTSGNVGLGTTVPLQSLDVRGTAIVSSGLGVGTTTVSTSGIEVYSSTGNNLGRFKSNDDTAYITVVDSDTTAVVLAKDSIASFGPSTSLSTNNINVKSTGEVGIGTTDPGEKLEVKGNFQIKDSASADVIFRAYASSDDGVLDVYRNNSVVVRIHGNSSSYFTGGSLGIGTTNPQAALHVFGDIVGKNDDTSDLGSTARRWANLYMASTVDYAGDLVFSSSGEKIRFTTGGSVGIGTTNPNAKLEVLSGTGDAIVGQSTSSAVVGQVTDAAGNCFDGRNSVGATVFSVNQSGAVSSLSYSQFSYIGIGATSSTYRLYVDDGRSSISHSAPFTTLTVTNSSTAAAIVGKSTSSAVVGQVTDAAGNCFEGRNSGDVAVFSVDQSGAVSSLGYSEFSYVGIGATNSTFRLYVDNGRASINHNSPLTTLTVTNSSTAPAIVGKSNSSAVVGQVTDAAGNCLEGRDSGDNIVFRVDQSGQIYSDAGTTIITPADLAEWNIVDGDLNDYPVGTLVQQTDKDMVVGRANDKSNKIYGVVTDRAAFLGGLTGIDREEQKNMSSKELEEKYNAKKITMCGHVPVRLIGPVKAGQVLSLSDKPGVAKVAETQDEKINIFAISRESKKVNEEVLVECRIL